MECVSGWFECDRPDRTSWSEMSWNLDKRRSESLQQGISPCFIYFFWHFVSVCLLFLYFYLFDTHELWHYVTYRSRFFILLVNSPWRAALLSYWVDVIYKINLPRRASSSLSLFSLPSPSTSALFLFFIIDSPETCSLQLFITSPFFPFYLVSLSDSPESPADCFSAREQIITLQRFSSAFLSSRLLSVLMRRERFDFVVGHCSPQSPGFLHVMENRAVKTGVSPEKLCNWLCVLSGVSLSGAQCLQGDSCLHSRRCDDDFRRESTLWRFLCRQAAVPRFITTRSFWGKLDGY